MITSDEHTLKEYKQIGDSVIKIANKYMVNEEEFNSMMEANTMALMFKFTINQMADVIRKHCDCKNIAEELIDKCYRDAFYKTLEAHSIVQLEDRLKRVPSINGHEGEF